MTVDEINKAYNDGTPVVFDDMVYKRVNAIITRKIRGKKIVQAELLDINGHSVIIANPKKVKAIKECI